MNLQQGFWRLGALLILSFFSPSLFAQNCANNQPPVANAGSDRNGNVGVSMTFSSQGSSDPEGNLTSYWFNFGDGQFTGWQPNPSVTHSFSSAGTYSLRLWVKDNCNVFSAADTAIITITAGGNPCAGNTPPVIQLSVPSSGVVGQSLSFSAANSSDPGGSIASYSWNFGDGSAANGVSVSKSYTSSGNFNVTLTLTDNCGSSAMANASISISAANPCAGNTAPVANAGPDKQGNPNVAITFSGSASSDANGNNTIQSYWFNFGDGSFTGWQSSASASHAFANIGSYTVRLWVRDNCGAMSASDLALVSIAAPNPCAGNQPPVAQATANPPSANINQSISFSAIGSSDPNGSITSYVWNFGDGSNGSGLNASHAYASGGNFNVVLTVTDNCNATNSTTKTVTINSSNPCQNNTAPTANAGAAIQNGQVNVGMNFNGSASSDPQGQTLEYWWNFGDGQFTNWLVSASTQHTYTTAGSYLGKLWVRDSCGATSSVYQFSIVIANAPNNCTGNLPPTAVISGGPSGSANLGQSYTFSAENSSDPNGQTLSYQWQVNGVAAGNAVTLNYTFNLLQSTQIILTVTDSCGVSSSDSDIVNVQDPNAPQLIADFKVYKLTHVDAQSGVETWEFIDIENEEIELGLRVKFDASLSQNAAFYLWNFGGSGATGVADVHAFDQPGNYAVALTIYNADGSQSNTITKTIHVARAMQFLDRLGAPPADHSTGLAVDGNIGFACNSSISNNQVKVLDLSDPTNLQIINTIETPSAQAIAAADGYIFLHLINQVSIYLQSNPPVHVGSYSYSSVPEGGGYDTSLVASRGLVFIAARFAGLRVIKPMPNGPPVEMGYFPFPASRSARVLAITDQVAYVGDPFTVRGIDIRQLSASSQPVGALPLLFEFVAPHGVRSLSVSGGKLAVHSNYGVDLYEHVNPLTQPEFRFYIEMAESYGGGTSPTSVLLHQNRLYAGFGPYAEYLDVDGQSIARFDVTNASSPYILEALMSGYPGMGEFPLNPTVRDDVIFWRETYNPAFAVRVSQP